MHGNEPAGTMAVPTLLDELRRKKISEDWHIRIITPVNPVGLEYQSRYNEDGCDINRDFSSFRTLEAQMQGEVVSNFKPNLIISFHEGPHDGFFMFTTSDVSHALEEAVLNKLQEHNVSLAEKSFFGLPLSKKGLWHEGAITSGMKKLLGVHTLGRYGQDQGIGVITTESSWINANLKERVQPHTWVIKAVLENYH